MNANDLFETVTNDLIAAVERGANGWTMPWQQLTATGIPRSADGRPYRGWNALVLAFTAFERGDPSGTWATYQGCQRHGGQVRRGEHGIAEAVEQLVTGADWQTMLDVVARFHTYSPNNIWLILAQHPDATRVAGYRTWRNLDRWVRKGEHGIAVLAPIVTRTKPIDTNDERDHPELVKVLRGFKIVHVFDIAQTGGTELPDVTPTLLTGDAPTAAWDMLAAHITDAGFALERGDCDGANGYTNHTTRTVRVRDDVDDNQAVKTLAHELGHVLLHDNIDRASGDRARMEIEAESIAYLVCHQLGIVSDDYSFAYLARWPHGDTNLIRTTTERAITCARRILASHADHCVPTPT